MTSERCAYRVLATSFTPATPGSAPVAVLSPPADAALHGAEPFEHPRRALLGVLARLWVETTDADYSHRERIVAALDSRYPDPRNDLRTARAMQRAALSRSTA